MTFVATPTCVVRGRHLVCWRLNSSVTCGTVVPRRWTCLSATLPYSNIICLRIQLSFGFWGLAVRAFNNFSRKLAWLSRTIFWKLWSTDMSSRSLKWRQNCNINKWQVWIREAFLGWISASSGATDGWHCWPGLGSNTFYQIQIQIQKFGFFKYKYKYKYFAQVWFKYKYKYIDSNTNTNTNTFNQIYLPKTVRIQNRANL